MFGKLLLIFIGIPFIEILILIKLGEVMGFAWTILLVIGTGFLGALAARIQGMKAWIALQREMQSGRMPGEQMIDALLIFIAGLVLITPGLLTDIAGFVLLIPFTRNAIKNFVKSKIDLHLHQQKNRNNGYGEGGTTIEVENLD